MANALTNLRPAKVSIVDKGANGKEFLVIKAATPTTQNGENDMDLITLAKAAGVTPDQVKGVIGALVAANKDATVATVAAAVAEPAKEKAPEIVALEKASADKDAKIALLEKAQAEERDIRVTAELTHMVKSEFPHVLGKVEDTVATIKALGGKDTDAGKRYVESLKATEAALAKSALFSETGSSLGGNAGVDSQIEALVTKALADNPKLTREQAFTRVYKSKEGIAIRNAAAH